MGQTKRSQNDIDSPDSELLYRLLFENARDGIYVSDIHGNILMANQAMADLSGYTIDELTCMNVFQILKTSDSTITIEDQETRQEDHDLQYSRIDEYLMMGKEGTQRTIEVVTSVVGREQGHPIIQAITRDITEHKQAQESARLYANLVTQAQEEERKRIARELHDDTIQSLASLGFDIDHLLVTNQELPKFLVESLNNLRSATDEILNGIRHFSQDLRPPMIEEFGLVETLQWLTDDLTHRTSLDVSLKVTGTPQRLSPHEELTLFRIAQEALSNIRKHSKATSVMIRAEFISEAMCLSIADNGRGFHLPKRIGEFAQSGKLGLLGMRERANLIDGIFQIQSCPGQGTIVTVSLHNSR
ncbi:MAG: PAS domain-containing sensor histidine kinase [Chloroflexota bacterium]|nr:PAS domain-containing sensor histidine kinase [Chloroflexota bacterium]